MTTISPSPLSIDAAPGAPGAESIHPWLNAEEAAHLLNVSACTLRRLAKRGEIPCRMVGTRYRFRYEELRDWPGCAPRATVTRLAWSEGSWRDEISRLNPYRSAK